MAAKAIKINRLNSTFFWRWFTRQEAVLSVNISGALPETYLPTPRFFPIPLPPTINGVLGTLRKAVDDPLIKSVHITLGPLNCGLAKAYEIASLVEQLEKKKKPVVVFAPHIGEAELLIANECSHVAAPPYGSVMFSGFSAVLIFLKDALDKIGVNVQAVRAGKYKSAVEMFLESEMSPASREQNLSIIESSKNMYENSINKKKENGYKTLFNTNWTPSKFQKEGWISAVAQKSFLDSYPQKDFSLVDESAYRGVSLGNTSKTTVALIPIIGTIVDGKGRPRQSIGDQDLVPLLRKARMSKSIDAVVLRVSSPGGSGLASSIISHEVELLQAKKPVIVSMSNVAASGGYLVSAPATKILCQPYTLTGSIGVFTMRPNVATLLRNSGVNVGELVEESTPYATMFTPFRGMTAAEVARIQVHVDELYHQFIETVSKWRGIKLEDMPSVAQGRVFTGEQAVANKLADGYGTLDQALALAAQLVDKTARKPPKVTLMLPRVGLSQLFGNSPLSFFASLLAQHPSSLSDSVISSSSSSLSMTSSANAILQDPVRLLSTLSSSDIAALPAHGPVGAVLYAMASGQPMMLGPYTQL